MNNKTQIQWLQGLQSFLNTLLQPIIKDQRERYRFLDADAMKIWASAFTHETFSPSDNYEDLEFLGDAVLKSVFPEYLMERLPHLHKGEYTELNVYYMSKIKQAELARKMGLGNYIRVTGIERAILNLETDVFESFFGALNKISNMIKKRSGNSNCTDMIEYLFRDIEIDESKGRGSAKTQVIQIFVRFDLPKPEEIINDFDKYHIKFSVVLLPAHTEFLRSYGVNINNRTIGYGQGATKAEAQFEAYTQAFDLLANLGITTEWAEEAKQIRDFTDPSVVSYVPAANERLKREGFISMYFFIPRKTVTPKGAVVQLVGVRNDGQHEVLSYIYANDRENSYRTAKTQIVQQYASGR